MKSEEYMHELTSPINVVGSTFGHFHNLLKIFEYGGLPPDSKYLFLGNLIGEHECNFKSLIFLFALKVKYPKSIYLIRGYNEHKRLWVNNMIWEWKWEYSKKVFGWLKYTLNELPLTATIDNHIFWVNSGLTEKLVSYVDITELKIGKLTMKLLQKYSITSLSKI